MSFFLTMHPKPSHLKKREKRHKNFWHQFLEKTVFAVAIIAPLTTLPQIIKIISTKTAAGVSLLTWTIYTLVTIPWIIYGIVHKEKPIIVSYVLWLILNTLVVIAILLYG